jgi:hypothetical protein
MKLGRAEDEVKKKIEAAKQATLERIAIAKELKSFNDSVASHEAGPQKSHVERTRESAQERFARADEVRRAGLLSDGATVRQRIEQEVVARQEARMLQHSRTEAELSGEFGRRSQLGAVTRMAGAGFAAGAAVVHAAGWAARTSEQLDRPAFQTEGQRNANWYSSIPLVGDAAKSISRWKQGSASAEAERERSDFLAGHRRQQEAAAYDLAKSHGVLTDGTPYGTAVSRNPADFQGQYRTDRYQALSDSARRRQEVHLESEERRTVMHQDRFQEGMSMLGVRREAEKHYVELDRITQQITEVERTRFQHKQRVLKLDREIENRQREILDNEQNTKNAMKEKVDSVHLQNLRSKQARSLEDKAIEQERLGKTDQELIQLKMSREEASQRHTSATKGADYWQSRTGYLEGRESQSRSQALSLGMAGPEARFMSNQAMEMVRRGNMEYLPPEILQQAASLHPREMQSRAIESGMKMQKDYPGENLPQLADAERQVNEARREWEIASVKAGQDMAKGQQAILRDMFGEMAKSFIAAMQSREWAEKLRETIKSGQ